MFANKIINSSRTASVRILTTLLNESENVRNTFQEKEILSKLSNSDKALAHEIISGTIRWLLKIDWIILQRYKGDFNSAPLIVKNSLRIAIYQILFLDKIPQSAAVNESVEIIKQYHSLSVSKLVNAVLRDILRNLNSVTYPDEKSDLPLALSVKYSHPRWMVRRWLKRFSVDEVIQIMEVNNERPKISIRVNPIITSTENFLDLISRTKIHLSNGYFLKDNFYSEKLSSIESNTLFKKGFFTIQDEGSALCSKLSQAKPGMRVIDLCSAPGGKALNIAGQMNNKGEIIAVDIYENKLIKITQAALRLGVKIIEPVLGDAKSIDIHNADIVFVDAPCSGLGVIRKKQDIKWMRTSNQINELVVLQSEILENAKNLVKPNGHLIYSTCTFEQQENHEIIKKFLEINSNFSIENANNFLPNEVVSNNGFLETYSHKHKIDGTFGVRLRKHD